MEQSSSFTPSCTTSWPKDKAEMMSRQMNGFSRWTSKSPTVTAPSAAPPSYFEATSLSPPAPAYTGNTDNTGANNTGDTESDLSEGFRRMIAAQDKEGYAKRWNLWKQIQDKPLTDANRPSTPPGTCGPVPFGAISVPHWAYRAPSSLRRSDLR